MNNWNQGCIRVWEIKMKNSKKRRTTKMKLNMRILCELNNAFNYEKCMVWKGKKEKLLHCRCTYMRLAMFGVAVGTVLNVSTTWRFERLSLPFTHFTSKSLVVCNIMAFAGWLWHIIAICYYLLLFFFTLFPHFSFVCSVYIVRLDLCNHYFFLFSWYCCTIRRVVN